MLNTLVSLKSYVGTIVIFVLFIISFVVMMATMNVPNAKFLMAPLTVSLGFALMNSVVYLNAIIKLKEENVEETNEDIVLSTCPEYWIKDTMYTKNDQNEYIPKSICKNFYDHPTKPDYRRYVGGSTALSSDSNSSFFDNFKSTYTTTDGSSPSNVADLFDVMNSDSDEQNEGFTDGFDTRSNVSDDKLITQDPALTNDDRRVMYVSNSNYPSFSNVAISNIGGQHYHYISSMQLHDNAADFDEHQQVGAVFHWHEPRASSMEDRELTGLCASNWICNDNATGGVIMNLDELNGKENTELCKHARQFHWVEAMNKCDVAGE